MALVFTCSSTVSLFSSSSSSIRSATAYPFSRSCQNSVYLKPKSDVGLRTLTPLILKERGTFVVKVSSDVDGVGSTDPESPPPAPGPGPAPAPAPPSESNGKSVPVEDLPLESKLQLKNEQQTRMREAKKIRLRKKALLRKRHLRKIGRWPPSKLKKNQNV